LSERPLTDYETVRAIEKERIPGHFECIPDVAAILIGFSSRHLSFEGGAALGLGRIVAARQILFLSIPTGWGIRHFEGRHYLPLGVLPAVMMIPLVLSGFCHHDALSFVSVL